MTAHQMRLWGRMHQHIDQYRNGKISFGELVLNLERTLDACEFKNQDLVKEWYEFWGPLEIRAALYGSFVKQKDVADELDAFERFLSSVCCAKHTGEVNED